MELQLIAESYLQAPRSLQELPLILIPEQLLSVSEKVKLHDSYIRQSIQEWLKYARLDDDRLRIERRLIPHTTIYIPNTPKGRLFFKIAKAIGDIPLNALVVPKSQEQGYWLKTLHYFWQARGVALANQLLKLIPDPLEEDGVLFNRLPATSLKNLKLCREVDFTCFQILSRGQRIIREWAAQRQIAYPFSNPLMLFFEILKQEFLINWQLEPGNLDWEWITKQKQRDYITTRAYLLREGIWQDASLNSAADRQKKQEYLEYLQGAGWNGYWLLAMGSQIAIQYNKQLEPYLIAYLTALSQGKELFVDEFDWRGGQPYKKRVKGQQITNSPNQLQGAVDLLGYIRWCWT